METDRESMIRHSWFKKHSYGWWISFIYLFIYFLNFVPVLEANHPCQFPFSRLSAIGSDGVRMSERGADTTMALLLVEVNERKES